MNPDSTRHAVAVILSVGLVLALILLVLTAPDDRLTFMLAGGLLSALSAGVGYLFRLGDRT